MSRLQNQIVNADRPPELKPTVIPKEDLRARFGTAAEEMIEQTSRKAFDGPAVETLNERLAKEWTTIAERLKAVMLPYERLRGAMARAGCQLTGSDLGLDPEFYRDAVRYSRYIRDRFSMLDVAGDSGQLEEFAKTCE
jgi:glycerol-1-phosphate dehydrogenase [NAD(P)+]